MEEDIFTPVDLQDTDDQDKDYLSELVGDDKKFKTTADLAKGKIHSDRHIKTLEEKLDELRKELDTRTKMEDFMTQVKNLQAPGSQPQNEFTPEPKNEGNGLDDSSLESKLEALLAQREQKNKSESNINKVQRVMKDNFGDNANLIINKKAQDLGMSPQALKQIAVESPTAFFSLVGAQEVAERINPPVAPRSGVNPVANGGYSATRNAAFYEKMKQQDPKTYFNPKTTSDMIRDRQALGDRFYS